MSENCLVAMDFSGQTGRVIENPLEAQSAAVEEGHAWRVNVALHHSAMNFKTGKLIFEVQKLSS